MRFLKILSALSLAVALAGCGGGGGNTDIASTSTSTKLVASIDWAARTRALNAPASAQSVVISINGATPDGGDFRFTINRDSAPDAYSKTYTSLGAVMLGCWTMRAMFYGQNDGIGDIVGVAGAKVDIKSDGSGLPSIATVGTFKTVSIPAGQTVLLGQNQDFAITAGTADASGAIVKEVAISPGSITWKITDGSDKLMFANGAAKGMVPGTATVTATVDGIVSAPQTVTVISTATIAISPATMTLKPGVSQPFTVALANAPDNSVTWTTQLVDAAPPASSFPSNPPPGTVASSGVYTAPMSVGTFKVTATSKFDPSKTASALVTVESPVQTLSLPTNDLVYSPVTDRLYASVPSRAGAKGNSIAIINPATAIVEATIPIGVEPGKMALADDGKTLYIALEGPKKIVKFDVPSRAAGTPFAYASGEISPNSIVEHMAVAPGHPELLAVSQGLPPNSGLSVFNNGIPIPVNDRDGFNRGIIVSLGFGLNSATLYRAGLGELSRYDVGASAVTYRDVGQIHTAFHSQILANEGRLYDGFAGKVYDLETLAQVGLLSSGILTGPDSQLLDSTALSKAVAFNLSEGVVGTYNLSDYSHLSSFNFSYLIEKDGKTDFSQADIRFSGGKSLAVRTPDKVYILSATPGL